MARSSESLAVAVAVVLAAFGALAQAPPRVLQTGDVVRGPARVTDSDKLVVDGVYLRLWGADGPEFGQQCAFANNQPYDCHSIALRELQIIAALGPVTCTIQRDTHRTRRTFVYRVCLTSDGRDVAEELVRAGHALAFVEQTEKYLAAEAHAEAAKAGLFRGRFQAPWDFAVALMGGGL
jgi:endonuclease YncB( thermonuclease family)